MTGELMKKCADESYAPAEGERSLPVFLFIDGKTWIIASAGEPRAYDTPVFSMNTVTENEAVMALTIHRMRYDYLLGRYITSEVGDLYSIRFEKSGDIWLCDEFPVFW